MATACSSSAATGKKRKRVVLTTEDKLGVQTLKQTRVSDFFEKSHCTTIYVTVYAKIRHNVRQTFLS